jgi:hypothetical protein
MKLWVTIKEMCIDDSITMNVQETETLQEYSNYLSEVREKINKPVVVSMKSGIRTVAWEKKKGRSGNSQHSTFNIKGRGAIDLVYTKELFDQLVKDNFFTRICYYPNNGFIHCDRMPHLMNGIQYFESQSPTEQWKFIKLL